MTSKYSETFCLIWAQIMWDVAPKAQTEPEQLFLVSSSSLGQRPGSPLRRPRSGLRIGCVCWLGTLLSRFLVILHTPAVIEASGATVQHHLRREAVSSEVDTNTVGFAIQSDVQILLV